MGKYNKYGVDKFGNVDPTRRMVHDMVGLFPSHGGLGTRKMADDLYSWMRKNKDGGKDDGNDDGKDDGKNNKNAGGRSPIRDVDFSMEGKPTYTRPIKKFDKGKAIEDVIGDPRDPDRFKIGKSAISKAAIAPTMKDGGVVRGAGCAQRGRGRGKIV